MADRTFHRSITERWVVEGTLVLKTPARFGNGDADPLTDMPLLLNEVDGKPLLTGSSIAGALRNYLRELDEGYGVKEKKDSPAAKLFGSPRETDEEDAKKGKQSPLIVDDAVCIHVAGFELRDGVAIDPETRTAADDKKFDMQLLAAGSTFPLRFELIVSQDSQELRDALVTVLHGLETSAITLGARKRRGFGECEVGDWKVFKYNLIDKEGLLDWLGVEQGWRMPEEQQGDTLEKKLDATVQTGDARTAAHLIATFKLNGTLMIRSGFGESDRGPDTVHIHSKRNGSDTPQPILPGTSIAGVLRQRALKIARTVSNNDKEKSREFVDAMFGPSNVNRGDKHARASRVTVKEEEIKNHTSLVVTRVKIDRFTGGAYEGALFSEQPLVGKPDTHLKLDLTLRKNSKPVPSKEVQEKAEKEFQAEIGLILLLLKDLWTGDLPIGGESGVGRGRLAGESATLKTPYGTWTFKADGEKVKVEPNAEELEKWVTAFNDQFKEAQVSHE